MPQMLYSKGPTPYMEKSMSNFALTKPASLACRAQQLILLAALGGIANGAWTAYEMQMPLVALFIAAMGLLPGMHLFGFIETFPTTKPNANADRPHSETLVPGNTGACSPGVSTDSAHSAAVELWYDLPPQYKAVSLLSREHLGSEAAGLPDRTTRATRGRAVQSQGATLSRASHVH